MSNLSLIGREQEQAILNKAYETAEAELIAVFGRRRVGKTFLVRSVYQDRIKFEITGIQNGSAKEQLQHFTNQLNYFARPILPFQAPENWQAAFRMLAVYLETQVGKGKLVLFLDEFPWLAAKRSDFLRAFGLFWNSWASRQAVVVVICGSAASWMISNVIRNKGGLHNRVTKRIHLQAFNLYETELFLQSRQVQLDRYHLLQLYMAMGGVPHYLKEVEGGKTATQNIDQICFSPHALLREEFAQLYDALFEQAASHVLVIRALASTRKGLSRQEIIQLSKLSDGGSTTKVLEELSHSGFITAYYAFGKKKKDLRYRLTDAYSLFYLKFMENKRGEGRGTWEKLASSQSWKSWSGYAFESICLQHLPAIKKAMGIAGIYTEASGYFIKNSELGRGAQIDLLLDRADQAIDLFEIKFYQTPFALTKAQAEQIRLTQAIFKADTKTSKQVSTSLLSTFPLLPNQHSQGLLAHTLDMNCLFQPFY